MSSAVINDEMGMWLPFSAAEILAGSDASVADEERGENDARSASEGRAFYVTKILCDRLCFAGVQLGEGGGEARART